MNDEEYAIDVYQEAGKVYWDEIMKGDKDIGCSAHQFKQIFDLCVIPAIKKVRALDRELRK